MSDWNSLINIVNGKLPTAILKCPSGRYKICGSVPVELTKEVLSGFSMVKVSLVWNTEQEAINALLAIGKTDFQLADCSWYHK